MRLFFSYFKGTIVVYTRGDSRAHNVLKSERAKIRSDLLAPESPHVYTTNNIANSMKEQLSFKSREKIPSAWIIFYDIWNNISNMMAK